MMIYNSENRIVFSKGLIILILISFVPVPYLLQYNIIYYLFNFLRVIAASLILVNIIMNKLKISKFLILIILFYVLLILSTFLNSLNLWGVIQESIFVILLCIFVDRCITHQKTRKDFFESIILIIEVLAYITLITVIFSPEGIYMNGEFMENHHFLGNRNATIRTLFPGVSLSLIYSHIYYKRITLRTYSFAFVVFFTILIMGAVTSIIAFSIIIIFMLFIYRIKIPTWVNIRLFFIIYIVLFFLIVVLRVQNSLSFFIIDVLDRDITLTGRVQLWDRGWSYIKLSPVWGYGFENPTIVRSKFSASSAHNYTLDLLYRGGVFLLLIHLEIIRTCIKRLMENVNDKLVQIISFSFFSYFIMWLTEPFITSGFMLMFIIFLLAYRVNDIRLSDHDISVNMN